MFDNPVPVRQDPTASSRRRLSSSDNVVRPARRHLRWGIAVVATLLTVLTAAGTVPASAASPIETMPLWRLQVRLTTGSEGTNGHPALRFNGTTTGVRTLNPPSQGAFDAGHVDTYDLRLLDSPSQITMLRIGIANDNWCIKKVELLFNGRVAFARDAVPGGSACVMVNSGSYLEFSSADLRSNPNWVGYGTPPPLPTGLNAANLKTLVTSVTGSAMLSSPGYLWDRSVPLTVTRTTSSTFRVAYGIVIVDPSGIEVPFTARITYDVRLFVDADRKLHATKFNASCCYHGQMSNFVVAQLDTALSRMTASPQANPLRFGIDSSTNITWSYTPVIG